MKSALKKLTERRGSSLPFVLIIGMIMLLLVASLLGVAVSNLNFTQESVENRQGYVDAKSVIEYGKIEINKRITALNDIDAKIKAETNASNLATLQNQRTALINTLSVPFTIYGVVDDSVTGNLVSDSLSLASGVYNGTTRKALGVCTVTPTDVGSGVTKFAFDLKTQNLRRELSYKIDFNYTVTSFSNWTTTTYSPVAKPTDATVGNWLGTDIKKFTYTDYLLFIIPQTVTGLKASIPSQNDINGNINGLTINVPTLSLNVGKDTAGFAWLNSATLNLTANNVYFTDSFPTTTTGAVFNMTASQIIFPGDLNIGEGETVNLTCEKLWVGGNINLGKNSKLIVNGTANKTTNQMVVGGKIITTRTTDGGSYDNLADVNISNLAYFESAGLDLDNNGKNDFKLAAKTVVIKGDISIDGYGWSDRMLTQITTPIKITTQYFDCSGKTTIKNIGDPSTPVNIAPDSGILNVRFAGGYDQRLAHVDIDGSSKVVFGTSLYLQSNGIDQYSSIVWSHLYVEGGDVYLEGSADNSIQMSDQSFIFGFKSGATKIYLYNQTKISYLGSTTTVAPGAYSGRCANLTSNSNTYYAGIYVPSYITRIGEYPANSTSGTTSTGNEKYY